jgi:hypothetical protein
MRKILVIILCLGFGVTQVLQAKDDKDKHHKKNAAAEQAGQNAGRAAAQRNQNASAGHHQQQRVHAGQQMHQNAAVTHRNRVERHEAQANVQRNNAARERNRYQAQVNEQRNRAVVREQNHARRQEVRANEQRNATAYLERRQAHEARNANRVIRNRNSYAEAQRRYNWHEYHQHNWWRNHYNRFSLFAGGYYFWNNGYWYPAYGYDSGYNTYAFNEPIYGYNGLAPGQVIVNVQRALADLGYYRGDIDGLIGPRTREALAEYQARNGLIVTRAVDEPTLESLGLT